MAGFGVATKTITWFLDFCVLSFLQYLPILRAVAVALWSAW